MAEEQKPAEVPQETVATEAAAETKVEETPAAAATTEAAPAEAAAPAAEATTEAAPAEEVAKEEVTPIEAGNLEHKGSNFPKNILYSKKHFWFGTDAVDTKALASFKADKAASVAHHIAAWASETGKGLLFYSEKADKAAPQGAIHLAEANEPTTEGANKFHFSAKGLKHTFKAANTAERDNWVSQLKLKIAEAKELVPTVTESETYKKTLESFKPVVAKKEEKAPAAAEAAKEEPAKEEAPKDAEAPAAEAKKEEVKKEEPKRRSASRKRTSIFGNLLGGKKEEEKKAAEPAEAAETEAKAAETTEAPAEASTAAETTEAPATEAAAETTEAPATTEPAAEAAAETTEEPKAEAKPKPAKRASIFGNLLKKKAAEPEAAASTPAKEEAPAAEAVAETAPVIPAVETTEPLSTDVAATEAAAEPTEAAAAVTNGETKKEVKSDKRKSSLPFGLGSKKEKSPTSDDEAEKPKSPSPFSKLRATIKGKGKAAEKAADKPAEAEAEAAKEAEPVKEEATEAAAAAPAEAEPVTEAAVPAEKAVATAPVIPAAA